MTRIVFLLTLLFSLASFAQESQTQQLSKTGVSSKFKVFKNIGEFSQISFRPPNSPLDFEYDVYYYIPSKLVGKKNNKALVFMHGGGGSTTTRIGSNNTISLYKNDFIRWAEELDYILIMPSGSGQNWSSHLLNYFRELNNLIRTDLPVDPDRIGLSGHSMGAMGITRSAQWLVDQYAFFLPMAGGIQDTYRKDIYLKTYFNTTYLHLQGRFDHFRSFLTRCLKHETDIKNLEVIFNQKSGFKLEVYEGGHNYDRALTKLRLGELFDTAKRDMYQTNLRGVFYNENQILETDWTYGEKIYLAPRNRYFWLRALSFSVEKKLIGVDAKITDSRIDIKADSGLKKLRVFLSNKTIDIKNPVKIYVNNKLVFYDIPTNSLNPIEQLKDPGFDFDTYVDLLLEKPSFGRCWSCDENLY